MLSNKPYKLVPAGKRTRPMPFAHDLIQPSIEETVCYPSFSIKHLSAVTRRRLCEKLCEPYHDELEYSGYLNAVESCALQPACTVAAAGSEGLFCFRLLSILDRAGAPEIVGSRYWFEGWKFFSRAP